MVVEALDELVERNGVYGVLQKFFGGVSDVDGCLCGLLL